MRLIAYDNATVVLIMHLNTPTKALATEAQLSLRPRDSEGNLTVK
jgi:hypothetical protein